MFFAGNSTADIGSLKNIGSIKDQSQKLLELIVVILIADITAQSSIGCDRRLDVH